MLKGHDAWLVSVTFSHDSRLLASASTDHTVKIWETRSGECLQTLATTESLHDLSFGSTSSYLYTRLGAIAVKSFEVTETDDIANPERLPRPGPSLSSDSM